MISGMENLGQRWRQMRFNPLRSLTPERLASALDQAAAGWLREAALIYETIEQREAIVRSVMTKRRAAVARRDWTVVVPDPDHPHAEAHKATLEYFYNNLTVTDATDLNVRTGMSGLLRQMMDAIIQRYAVHEIVWQPGPGGLTAELRRVPLYFFENRTGRLQFIGPESRSNGTPLAANGWMVTVADGLGEALSICYMYKRLGIQDLLAFSEKFSIPGVIGRTAAQADSAEGRAMAASVAAYASEWVGVVYGDDGAIKDPIQVIQTPAGASLPQMTIAEYMDRMIATLVRGGDLSTVSRDNATGSNPQQADADSLLEDDCALVSETLQTQLDRRVIQMVHGDDIPAAYVVVEPPATQDSGKELAIDTGLAALGVRQDPADLAERYGRELAEEITAPAENELRALAGNKDGFVTLHRKDGSAYVAQLDDDQEQNEKRDVSAKQSKTEPKKFTGSNKGVSDWKTMLEQVHDNMEPQTQEQLDDIVKDLNEWVPAKDPHAMQIARNVIGIKQAGVDAYQKDPARFDGDAKPKKRKASSEGKTVALQRVAVGQYMKTRDGIQRVNKKTVLGEGQGQFAGWVRFHFAKGDVAFDPERYEGVKVFDSPPEVAANAAQVPIDTDSGDAGDAPAWLTAMAADLQPLGAALDGAMNAGDAPAMRAALQKISATMPDFLTTAGLEDALAEAFTAALTHDHEA